MRRPSTTFTDGFDADREDFAQGSRVTGVAWVEVAATSSRGRRVVLRVAASPDHSARLNGWRAFAVAFQSAEFLLYLIYESVQRGIRRKRAKSFEHCPFPAQSTQG